MGGQPVFLILLNVPYLKFQERGAVLLEHVLYHVKSLFNCDRSAMRRGGGGTSVDRQRQKGGDKVEKDEEKVGFSFLLLDIFFLFVFEGEEGVGRVRKPDRERGVHREEIFQKVTCRLDKLL